MTGGPNTQPSKAMDAKLWQHQTFYNTNETSKNFLDFQVYDLTDVNLGRFVIGLQSTIDFQKFATIKNIIRESIERFAVIAKPLTVSEGLEKIYAYINKHGRDVLDVNDYRDMHIAIVYIKDNEMHFSLQGDLKLMLIRKNHIFDVIKMTYGLAPHNYDKLFSRMYSGAINEDDHIVLTSFETWDCFDTQKLAQIVSKLSADSAVGFLSNYLPEHSPYRLGGLLINLQTPKSETYNPNKPHLSPADSLKELISTEDKTSEWISPSPKQKVSNLIETFKNISDRYLKFFSSLKVVTKYVNISNRNKLKPIQYQKVTTTQPEPHKVIRKQHLPGRKLRFTNPIKNIKSIPGNVTYFFSQTKRLYTKWPKSTKYLLIIAIVLIVTLTQSISYTQKKNTTQEQNTFFNQQITDIEQQHTQANQAIIFKDYSKARTLLINASNSIASLPAQNTEQQDKKQSLSDTNKQLLERANRQTLINNPEIIASITTSAPNSITDLNIKNNTLLILTSNEVFKVNLDNNNLISNNLSENLSNIKATSIENPVDNDSLLIAMHGDSLISSINPDNGKVTGMNTTINNNGTTGINIYTNRLYAVNKDSEQIIRYQQGSASFQAGQSWLQIPSSLAQAHDIAVDGNVYVLESSAGIMQFNQGARTSWRSEQLDPGLQEATKLTTTIDSDYLYILDPANKRFLVYDKQGDFLQQFTSPKFDNLIDIAIIEDGTESTAYMLNGVDVIKVEFKLK